MSNLPQLQQDWFAALGLVRQAVPWHNVTSVWEAVEDRVEYAAGWSLNAAVQERDRLTLTAHIEHLPRIERMEILLYAGCRLSFELHYGTPIFRGASEVRESFRGLCLSAGCDFTNHSNPRARWRDIGFRQGEHLLLVSPFEDRPLCPFCKRPVATGAGAWSTSVAGLTHINWQSLASLQRPLLIVQEQPSPEHLWYRPDLHSECWNYASRVLAPQARRQKEREEKEAEAFARGEQK